LCKRSSRFSERLGRLTKCLRRLYDPDFDEPVKHATVYIRAARVGARAFRDDQLR
jgi:hypothetical protein